MQILCKCGRELINEYRRIAIAMKLQEELKLQFRLSNNLVVQSECCSDHVMPEIGVKSQFRAYQKFESEAS